MLQRRFLPVCQLHTLSFEVPVKRRIAHKLTHTHFHTLTTTAHIRMQKHRAVAELNCSDVRPVKSSQTMADCCEGHKKKRL
ncbi:hypothetical protein NQZ68_027547 [Dissostichus eleginoides]|nr:hypothetical protein NQZ68_027547 [Dissostichus eleginoides]